MVVEEWYVIKDELSQLSADSRIARVQSKQRKLKRLFDQVRGSESIADLGPQIADELYDIRNSVLAHVSVLSTGNLFDVVIPRFEQLVADVATCGWAIVAGVEYQTAKGFLNAGAS